MAAGRSVRLDCDRLQGALAVLVLLFIEDWRMGLSMLIVVPLGIGCFASMFRL